MDLEIFELPIVGVGRVTFDTVMLPAGTEELARYGSGWNRSLFMGDKGEALMIFTLRRGGLELVIEPTRWELIDHATRALVETGQEEFFADVFRAGTAAMHRRLFGLVEA